MNPRLQVCLDIGSQQHQVALGTTDEGIAEMFNIAHTSQGMQQLFERIERINGQRKLPVVVAMEGFNGHARPLDKAVLAKGYQLFNVNNHKLARFKEIFPAAAKTDAIDVKKMFELMTLQAQQAIASDVLQDVACVSVSHEKLKRLSRRRKQLVEEKTLLLNRLWSDLQAVTPGLVSISKRMGNAWFLRFLLACDDYQNLLQLTADDLRKIPGIGQHYCRLIQTWQQHAYLASDIAWVWQMVLSDVKRIVALKQEITSLEEQLLQVCEHSSMAQRLASIPGFGVVTRATLAGEIGTLARFKQEGSLAIYLGVAPLTKSSGKYQGSRQAKHVNQQAKVAYLQGVARHIMTVPTSKAYYLKKRAEGKSHIQAITACARHLVRVIWSMLTQERDYYLPKIICKT